MAANHLRVFTRTLSTSAGRLQLVQTPIQVFGTEGRYATALYSAATKKKALDAVEKDLKTFSETLKKDGRLADFLADPSIQKSLKAQGLVSACDKLKMNELSKNLFLALAENGRFSLVEAVSTSFNTIMAAHRGEVVCEVTTAKAIDGPMKKEVEAAIGKFMKQGQKSIVNYKVDPSIIGGMVVSIGDKYADMSIATKLNKYSEIIKSAA
jgi:F-type H+-transporting ATPase subunit O